MMLRRRQVIAIVSIGIVSFILGTLFDLNLMTAAKQDDGPMPVWPTYVTGVNATALPDVWNVTVANWPVSTDVNVWWNEHIDTDYLTSSVYKANGFSQLHVLVHESGLGTTEPVYFWIYGKLWNTEHTGSYGVQVAELILDGCHTSAAITIPVPSEDFYFSAGTIYECDVSLSFYLTWA
jgi:hypothetical protein